jgi:hypothetical protein
VRQPFKAQAGYHRSRITRARWAGAFIWLLPVLAIVSIYDFPHHFVTVDRAVTYLLALGLVVVASRRPDRSLLILIAVFPFAGFLLSELWALGMPASVVKHLGAWKEVLALGVVLAGARNFLTTGRRFDVVDRLALGFVVIAALYAALQAALIPGAPSASNVRLLGFRETAGFVLLLLGARHAPLPPGFLTRAGRVLVAVSAVVAALAVFENVASSTWNDFVVNTIKYTRYQIAVLDVSPFNVGDIRSYGHVGGSQIVRSGSVFVSSLTCGFYLVLGFAAGIERFVRKTAGPFVMLATIVIGAGLLLTQTRSAILAALIVAFLALEPAAGRRRHWRTQVALLLSALAIVAIPASIATGLVDRVGSITNQSDPSTAGHRAGFWTGLDVIRHHPLGQGLGTAVGTGQRFAFQNVTVPENNYLEVGAVLGVLPMLIFVALTVALVLRLRRAAREVVDPLVTASWAAVAGLAVSAWFLQTWAEFAVAWTVWGLAGAVLGVASRQPSAAAAADAAGGAAALSDIPTSNGRRGAPRAGIPVAARATTSSGE